MSDSANYTFDLDTKLRDKFERKADLEHRTIASQIRLLMEAYVENRLEVKE